MGYIPAQKNLSLDIPVQPITFNQWLSTAFDQPELPTRDYREKMMRQLQPGKLRDFIMETTRGRADDMKKLKTPEKIAKRTNERVEEAASLESIRDRTPRKHIRIKKDQYKKVLKYQKEGKIPSQ